MHFQGGETGAEEFRIRSWYCRRSLVSAGIARVFVSRVEDPRVTISDIDASVCRPDGGQIPLCVLDTFDMNELRQPKVAYG